MEAVPIAHTTSTSYENLVAECPSCGYECIFNRASDLHTFEPIGGFSVSCLNTQCGNVFRIIGDTVNAKHEMLIYDCYELIERKHYMNCILSLAQAYEMFFSLFLQVELLYKPFAADPDLDIDKLNRLSEDLEDKIKSHTFGPMRALFLRHLTERLSAANLDESAVIIAAFPTRPGDPKESAIEALNDVELVQHLKALKATTINTLRNQVVHKRAYRPTHGEVEAALKETRSILFPLTMHLKLYDDINWYMGSRA